MKKITYISFIIIIGLSLNYNLGFAETATPTRTPAPQQSAQDSSTSPTAQERTDQNNQQTYQQLRDSLIPKQSDFIQKSKNLDVDGNNKVSEEEQKLIQFTEGNLETQILPRILKMLIYSSILIFTGLFVYAGVILLISNGNEQAFTQLKNLIVNTLIGVGVILGSYAIVYGIVTILQNLR